MNVETPTHENVNPLNVTEEYRDEVRLGLATAIANSPNRLELEKALFRYGAAAAATAERRALQGHGEAVLRWGHFGRETAGVLRHLWEIDGQPEID